MKVCVIQPHYSFEEKDAQQCFDELLELMDQCDESMDLIVLPEYSDALADVKSRDGFYQMVDTYNEKLLTKAAETAKATFRTLPRSSISLSMPNMGMELARVATMPAAATSFMPRRPPNFKSGLRNSLVTA